MWPFTKKKRGLFEFRDGLGRKRFADPIVVWRNLQTDPEFNWERHTEELFDDDATDQEAYREAQEITSAAIRRAADILPWSMDHPEGLTESESVILFVQFCTFINALKKNGSPTQISPRPTASAGVSTTRPEPECISISAEQ